MPVNTATDTAGRPARPPSAFAIRNFRIYYLGALISVPGTWMQTTGQAWLVLQLTNSPLALATVAALQFLPSTLFALLGGAVADRFPRRRLMLFNQCFVMGLAILMGVLIVTGHVTIWWLYGMAFALGCINALEHPLRSAFVSELVPLDRLSNAIALNATAFNMGRIIGPALGGVVIAVFGVAAVFFINAATFIATISALLLLNKSELQPVTQSKQGGTLKRIGEGLSFARRTPSILFLLIGTLFIGMFGQNFTTMVPLVAEFLVHASPAEFGIINSALGCGSLAASITLARRRTLPNARRIITAGIAYGCILIVISLSSNLWLSSLLFFMVGFSAVSYSASVTTSMQVQSPPSMRGRIASMQSLLIPGASPIGAMVTGGVASAFGVWAAISFNGVMCIVGMGVMWLYIRSVRASLGAGAVTIVPWVEPLPAAPPSNENLPPPRQAAE